MNQWNVRYIFGVALLALGLAFDAGAASTALSTSFSLGNPGSTVSGRLTSSNGLPIANASLRATAVDVTARGGLSWRTAYGTAPRGATTALIAIRAGTEGACVCNGPAGAAVGGIYYIESGTGWWQDVSPVSLPVYGAPDSIRTLSLVPGQSIALDLRRFPITPGVNFALTMPMSATANAAGAAYVAVIFYDVSGRELQRNPMWFTPVQQDLGSVATDANGAFSLAVPAALGASLPEIDFTYAGSFTALSTAGAVPSAAAGDQQAMPALAQQLPGAAQLGGKKLVWFTPREDFINQWIAGASWDSLAQQWGLAAQRTNILKLSSFVLLSIPDSELPRMLRQLDDHHIALGLEIEPANWYHEVQCGGGLESYSDPGTANLVVYKILKAGGKLSAVTMDEPLWFGRYYAGVNACRSSIADEARRVAVIVKIFTAAFPNLVVGDTEPFPEVSFQPNWQAEYAAWVQAFQAATGTPLSFLHVDYNWDRPSLQTYGYPNAATIGALSQLVAATARASGLQVGIIATGNSSAMFDALWVWQAQGHLDAVEASGIAAEQVLFETWTVAPARTLPETDPNTITGLMDWYFLRYP